MRIIATCATVLALCFTAPAIAQETPDPARQAQLELADRYLALTQGADAGKVIREQLEESYAEQDLPDDQRAWLTDQFTSIFDEVMSAAMAEVRDDVADTYTAGELQAAIAFYETPLGRSVARKDLEISVAMQEAMMPLLMTRMASMTEKFCQRFDCAELGAAAAKSGR